MIIVISHGADRHGHIIIACSGVDLFYRRGEINHIQPAIQFRWQLRVNKIDHDPAAPEPHINRNSRVGQINDHPPLAIFTPAKINIFQTPAGHTVGTGKDSITGSRRRPARIRAQSQDDIAAFDSHVIRDGARQIDHHARATGGFNGIKAVRHADADPL